MYIYTHTFSKQKQIEKRQPYPQAQPCTWAQRGWRQSSPESAAGLRINATGVTRHTACRALWVCACKRFRNLRPYKAGPCIEQAESAPCCYRFI